DALCKFCADQIENCIRQEEYFLKLTIFESFLHYFVLLSNGERSMPDLHYETDWIVSVCSRFFDDLAKQKLLPYFVLQRGDPINESTKKRFNEANRNSNSIQQHDVRDTVNETTKNRKPNSIKKHDAVWMS